jgi:uncharacterized membrane protein
MSASQSASQSASDSVARAATDAAHALFDVDPTVTGRVGPSASTSEESDRESATNVGKLEREVSLVVGATLGLLALTKPISLRGLLLGGAGVAMIHRGVTGRCQLYKSLGINTVESDKASRSAPESSDYFHRGIHVEETILINKPASELYAFWRSLDNLPKVMRHLKEVKVIDAKKSHWVAKAPLGFSVEWDAEIINENEGQLIAWRSTEDATVSSAGSVRFIERGEDRGTEVRVVLDYLWPGGKIGSAVARLFGEEPGLKIRDDLRRFKQKTETGETTTNANAQPRGNCSRF